MRKHRREPTLSTKMGPKRRRKLLPSKEETRAQALEAKRHH
jgi:hypothetical protein